MGVAARASVPTLADVADRAGVSKATASKALADRYGVSQATRDRVVQAARELKFTPNPLARGLGGGSTKTVGMITADIDGRFAPQIMFGVEDALGADRSSVIMCNSRGRQDLEDHHIRELLRRSVDGLIVVGDSPESRPPITPEASVPVVYAYAPSLEAGDVSVVCDNVEAGRLAAAHLISVGRTKLVHIAGPQRDVAARDRQEGFRTGASVAGVRTPMQGAMFGDWSEQWGWQATSRLIEGGVDFDGLVCGDDQIARGALDQLLSRGLRVPGEVDIIGFDNWSVLSEHCRHPFSSVDMNLPQVGRAAAQALLTGDPRPGIQRIAGRVAAR